jgi:polyvinyl alcohol dehydrogenase (cytochrome)
MRRVITIVLLCVVAALAVPGASTRAATFINWPGFLFRPTHTSTSNSATAITPANANSLVHAWTWHGAKPTMTGQPAPTLAASPTVFNGVVYIGANTGVFYALNESTGAVMWSRFIAFTPKLTCNAAKGFTSTATVAKDPTTGKLVVYVGAADGYLYALNAATGSTVWRAAVGIPSTTVNDYYLWGSPTVSGGRVYIGISSQCDNPLVRGGVKEFNQSTGASAATYFTVPSGSTGGSVWSAPAVSSANGNVFVTTGNGNPKSPSQGDSVSIVRLSSSLVKQDIWTVPGSMLMRDDDFGGSPALFTAVIGGKTLAMVGACNKNGWFYALKANNLAAGPVWKLQIGAGFSNTTGDQCIASSVWDGTHLYIAGNQTTIKGTTFFGSIREVDPATGNVIWATGLPGAIMGTPTLDGSGVIAAASYDGATGSTNAAFLLNANTGQLLTTITTNSKDFGQPVFADNMLLIPTNSQGLIAYHP